MAVQTQLSWNPVWGSRPGLAASLPPSAQTWPLRTEGFWRPGVMVFITATAPGHFQAFPHPVPQLVAPQPSGRRRAPFCARLREGPAETGALPRSLRGSGRPGTRTGPRPAVGALPVLIRKSSAKAPPQEASGRRGGRLEPEGWGAPSPGRASPCPHHTGTPMAQ